MSAASQARDIKPIALIAVVLGTTVVALAGLPAGTVPTIGSKFQDISASFHLTGWGADLHNRAEWLAKATEVFGLALGIAVLGTTLFTTLGRDFESKAAAIPALNSDQVHQLTEAVTASAGAVIPQFKSQPGLAEVAQAAGEGAHRHPARARP